MRLRRTPKDENRVQRAGPSGRVSLWYKLPWMAVAWRSGNAVWTSIPSIRLTRAGKGTTICRTQKREGRIAVSVTDLRRSNRLRPRRCYANHGRAWLWTGCASGHGSRLFVDCSQEWESPEADTNVRHYHTRAGQLARMVALGRLHACSYSCCKPS